MAEINNEKLLEKEEPKESKAAKVFAILSTVMGLISILFFPFFTGPLGIIFGIISKKLGYKKGLSTGGIVCGAVGLALHITKILLVPCDIWSILIY